MLESSQSIRQKLVKSLEDKDDSFYKEVKKIVKYDESVDLIKSIVEKHGSDDFLTEEQMIVGHPPNFTGKQAEEYNAQGKKLPETYYIVQKKISGENVVPLTEITDKDLISSPELTERLCVFAMLTKKLYSDAGKLIDLRPEEVAKHPFEWFTKTTNVLVDKNSSKLYFVDTRWLYDRDSRLGRNGINIIEQFGLNSVDRTIANYAKLIQFEKSMSALPVVAETEM